MKFKAVCFNFWCFYISKVCFSWRYTFKLFSIRKTALVPLKILITITLEIQVFMPHDLSRLPTLLLSLQESSFGFLCISLKTVLHKSALSCCFIAEVVFTLCKSLLPLFSFLLYGIICLRGHAVFKTSAIVRDTHIFQGQKMRKTDTDNAMS